MDRLHPETAQCLDFKIAKVFVKADLSKELPEDLNFNFQGKVHNVEFKYPWLPPRCTVCKKWGHLQTVCLVKNGTGVEGEKHNTPVKKALAEELAKSLRIVEREGMVEKVITEKVAEGKDVEAENPESNVEEAWREVNLAKAGRSPVKQKHDIQFGQVSKYAILNQDEDGEEEKNGEDEEGSEVEVVEDERAEQVHTDVVPSEEVMMKSGAEETEGDREREINLRKPLSRNSKG